MLIVRKFLSTNIMPEEMDFDAMLKSTTSLSQRSSLKAVNVDGLEFSKARYS